MFDRRNISVMSDFEDNPRNRRRNYRHSTGQYTHIDTIIQFRITIEMNYTRLGFAPTVKDVNEAFADNNDVPYRSRQSFHRVLKVNLAIIID